MQRALLTLKWCGGHPRGAAAQVVVQWCRMRSLHCSGAAPVATEQHASLIEQCSGSRCSEEGTKERKEGGRDRGKD